MPSRLPSCHPVRALDGKESFVLPRFVGLRGLAVSLMKVLREIFDESAYSRFLLRTQLEPSRESYLKFMRENELAKARRPRCC